MRTPLRSYLGPVFLAATLLATPVQAQYPDDLAPAPGLEDEVIVPATPEPAPAAATAVSATVEPANTGAPPQTKPESKQDEPWLCPPPDIDLRKMYVICGVAEKDRFVHIQMFPEPQGVLEPNRAILVMVLHPVNRRIAVGHGGKYGLYTPGIQGPSRIQSRGPAEVIPNMITRKVLPPHMPPSASVELVLKESPDAKALDEVELEFLVRETFAGALRIGIGAVGLGASSPVYSVRTQVGSVTPEIVAQGGSSFDMELVVGYAAFLDHSGRSANGCDSAPLCFAPYVGLGVLTQGNDGLALFSSFHLGMEWAPVTGFSIAFTLVGRRVDQLAKGLNVGGPARAGDNITVSRYALGGGLVFNVSPDVLKFASGTAAGLWR